MIDSYKALKVTRKTANLTQSKKNRTEKTETSTQTTTSLTSKMTELAIKAIKEGSVIMAFTIVTIIFVSIRYNYMKHAKSYPPQLPLSFMATMFQLDIRQYPRMDDKSTLVMF